MSVSIPTRQRYGRRPGCGLTGLLAAVWLTLASPHAAATAAEPDAAVAALLTTLEAEGAAQGVQPATIKNALDGFERDAEVVAASSAQPEHERTVGDYLGLLVSQSRIENGTARLAEHAALLDRIKARFGVEPAVLIAVWGIESRYGEAPGTRSVIRSLATLALEDARRGAFWRGELVQALKIVQAGDIGAAAMIGSWAGAMGHTQFMPSTYNRHAVDFDGDGRRDIWASAPDALASAANYLAHSGWQAGERWGIEVTLPKGFDFWTLGSGTTRPATFWREQGIVPAAAFAHWPAFRSDLRLLLPAGANGPAFLVGRNFTAILRYNPAVSYALAVGHLADRVAGEPPFAAAWPAEKALSRAEREELQRRLAERGLLATGGVDGVIGSLTRTAIRSYQKDAGLAADGHPTLDLLQRLRPTDGGGTVVPQ